MSEPFLNYLNHTTVAHLSPTGPIHLDQPAWRATMSAQECSAIQQFSQLYRELILQSPEFYNPEVHRSEPIIVRLRESLRELRRLMMEGTGEDQGRRTRGISIYDLQEDQAKRRFGFTMDGSEVKSEDEIRAEARAADLKKKAQGPVYGPPKPPGMQ